MVSAVDVLKVVLEFIAVTIIAVIADRYLSDTWAFGILGICLIGLGVLHREWLLRFAQDHRFITIALCIVAFASVGLVVGIRLTKPPPSEQNDAKVQEKTKVNNSDLPPTALTLRQLFETDFPDMLKGRNDHSFTDNRTGQEIIITKQLYLDHVRKSKFVGFFVPTFGPKSHETRDICSYLSSNYQLAFELEKNVLAAGTHSAGTHTERAGLTGRGCIQHQ